MTQYQVSLQAYSRMSCKKERCMWLVFLESKKIRKNIGLNSVLAPAIVTHFEKLKKIDFSPCKI
jgi:hypothetical protein